MKKSALAIYNQLITMHLDYYGNKLELKGTYL